MSNTRQLNSTDTISIIGKILIISYILMLFLNLFLINYIQEFHEVGAVLLAISLFNPLALAGVICMVYVTYKQIKKEA